MCARIWWFLPAVLGLPSIAAQNAIDCKT